MRIASDAVNGLNFETSRTRAFSNATGPRQSDEGTRWSVTVNLPDNIPDEPGPRDEYMQKSVDDIVSLFTEGEIRYAVGQFERGSGTNRYHLQAYVVLRDQHRGIWVSNRISNNPYLLVKKATQDANMRKYCCNPEKQGFEAMAFEHGPWPLRSNQGERNDMHDLRSRIVSGEIKDFWGAVEHNPNLVARTTQFTKELIEHEVLNRENAEWRAERALSIPYEEMVWQHYLRMYLTNAPREDRKIIFICDTRGSSGKSRFIEEFVDNSGVPSRDLTAAKTADMAAALEVVGMRVLFFDITRSKNEFCGHVYDFAENIKSGKMFASKYHSKMKRFAPPHIVVFTNDEIDLGGRKNGKRKWCSALGDYIEEVSPMPLTWDRYQWWDLNDEYLQKYTETGAWANKCPPFKCLNSQKRVASYDPPRAWVGNVDTMFPENQVIDGPPVAVSTWPDVEHRFNEALGGYWCMKLGQYFPMEPDVSLSIYWKYSEFGNWFLYYLDRENESGEPAITNLGRHLEEDDWTVHFPPSFTNN